MENGAYKGDYLPGKNVKVTIVNEMSDSTSSRSDLSKVSFYVYHGLMI